MLRGIGGSHLLPMAAVLTLLGSSGCASGVVSSPAATAADASALSSPGGTSEVYINEDGTASAIYRPGAHTAQIARVEFWLRRQDGRWTRAGTSDTPTGGAYLVIQLDGTQQPGWSSGRSALSVHVVWSGGSQFVDPVPWVPYYRFQTSPTPPPQADPRLPAAASPPPVRPASPLPDDPYPDATLAGASAVCEDGTWSFERALVNVCVHHGGVRWWTGNIGSRGPGQH